MYSGASATADFFNPPVPLVALCGFSDLHSLIRDNIPNPRAITFTSYPDVASAQLPLNKQPQRDIETFAWHEYRPRGIFKRAWFDKHRHASPSVAVLMFEWDEAREWTPQEANIINAFNQCRLINAGRTELRYMIVVIRHRNVQNDEIEMEDRMIALRRQLGLTSRQAFMIKTADLKNSLKKFESFVLESAVEHYRALIRRSRRVCERLDRSSTAQLCLIVRHLIKIGYYCEQAKDEDAAIKQYHQAYDSLRFVPATATTAVELKEVACFVNFKLVRLLLSAGKPAEACEQFIAHTQVWRIVQVPSDPSHPLAALNWSWLARQYIRMAEFLDIMSVSPAVAARYRTMHSAYYYHTAYSCLLRYRDALQSAARQLRTLPALSELVQSEVPASSISPFLGQLASEFPIAPESGAAGAVQSAQADVLLSLKIVQHLLVKSVVSEAVDAFQAESDSDVCIVRSFHAKLSMLLERANAGFAQLDAPRASICTSIELAESHLSFARLPHIQAIEPTDSEEASLTPVAALDRAARYLDSSAPLLRTEKWRGMLARCLRARLGVACVSGRWRDAAAVALELCGSSELSDVERSRCLNDVSYALSLQGESPADLVIDLRDMISSGTAPAHARVWFSRTAVHLPHTSAPSGALIQGVVDRNAECDSEQVDLHVRLVSNLPRVFVARALCLRLSPSELGDIWLEHDATLQSGRCEITATTGARISGRANLRFDSPILDLVVRLSASAPLSAPMCCDRVQIVIDSSSLACDAGHSECFAAVAPPAVCGPATLVLQMSPLTFCAEVEGRIAVASTVSALHPTSCTVVFPAVQIAWTLEHQAPALTNEFFNARLVFDTTIVTPGRPTAPTRFPAGSTLSLRIQATTVESSAQSASLLKQDQTGTWVPLEGDVQITSDSSSASFPFAITSSSAGEYSVSFRLSWPTVSGAVDVLEGSTTIAVVDPFVIRARCYSQRVPAAALPTAAVDGRLLVGEDAWLSIDVENVSPHALNISVLQWHFNQQYLSCPVEGGQIGVASLLQSPLTICGMGRLSALSQLRPIAAGVFESGTFAVRFSRQSSSSTTEYRCGSPHLSTEVAPFIVSIDSPAQIELGSWAAMRVRVDNLSDAMYELAVNVVESAAAAGSSASVIQSPGAVAAPTGPAPLFAIGGARAETTRICARGSCEFRFSLAPLVAGQLTLPQIALEARPIGQADGGGAIPLFDTRDAGMCFVVPRVKSQVPQRHSESDASALLE